MPAKVMTATDAAALLATVMHARTYSATRRHYTATGVKTLCGGAVFLPERWAVDGVEHSVALEDLFMESAEPRPYCVNCDKVRARLERQARPAHEAKWLAAGTTVVVDGFTLAPSWVVHAMNSSATIADVAKWSTAAAEVLTLAVAYAEANVAAAAEAEPVAPEVLAARLAAGHTVVVDGITFTSAWVSSMRGRRPVGEVAAWAAEWLAGQVEAGNVTPRGAEVLALATAYAYAGTPTTLPVQPYTVPSLAAWIAPGRSVVVDGLEITEAKVEEMRECLARGKNTELARTVWVESITCLDRITATAARALITAAATCPNCDAIHETGMALTVEASTCPGEDVEHEHGEDCGAYAGACFTSWDAAHEFARATSAGVPGFVGVYLLDGHGVPCADAGAYVDGEPVD